MNLSLIDPFVLAQDYPESLAGTLRSGHATCLRFNKRGDFLASGRADGTVVIFDIETNGVARKLRGHTRQIQSLSWSRDGRFLLSSSQDWKCVLWDLKDGSRVRTVRFEAPVYIAELHPYNHLLFVASLFEDQPTLVDISSAIPIKRLLPSAPKRPRLEGEDGTTGKQDAKQNTCVTIFTSSGHHILAGTSKGWLNIIETATCESIYSTRLSSGVVIFLRLTVSGRDMVVNSSDRILRTIHMPNLTEAKVDPDSITIEVEHKFQDVVNRLSWNHVAFSSTGEYVMASTYKNHDIYVWERSHGSLVKILEGPKEELGVVEVSRRATESLIHFVESSADIPFSNSQWHPHRPLVAACGLESGHIYLWTINTPQRWSALAPDFAEVEENVEYIEREDEFDIHPIEEIHKRRLDLEDENVDVLTVEPRKGLGVEDDESGDGSGIEDDEDTRRGRHGDATAEGGQTPRRGNGAFRMPVLLDISESESEEEIVTVGPGTMRRKSPVEGREWMNGSGGGAGGDGGTGAGAGAGPAESGGGSDFERGPGRAVNGTRRTAAAAVSTTTTATATAAAAAASNGPSSTSNKRSRKR